MRGLTVAISGLAGLSTLAGLAMCILLLSFQRCLKVYTPGDFMCLEGLIEIYA